MLNEEIFLLESPNIYKDFSDEEGLNNIFSQNIGIDMQDINDEYLFNHNSKSRKIENNKTIENNAQNNNSNDDKLLLFGDFESYYSKFADIKQNNDIEPEIGDYINPCLIPNLDENKLKYSLIDENQYIKVEIGTPNEKNKIKEKEKIFGIVKEKKKYENNHKINHKLQKRTRITHHKFYHRRKKYKTQIDISDKCFPFKSGKIINVSSKQIINVSLSPGFGNSNSTYTNSQDSSSSSKQDYNPPDEKEENIKNRENNNNNNLGQNKDEFKEGKYVEEFSNYNEKINNLSDNFILKFTTKKYFVAPNGKKKRVKKKRKFKPDDIRKKIKARFHKTIKNIINENLKKAGSKELFDFLPQCFIGNVSKKTNSKCFELTYKELLSTNFLIELHKEDYRNSKVDQNKYKKNVKVLDYLEQNPDICKRSGFDLIKDRKYKDLLNIYFTSAQFENSLIQLKAEKESPEYIQEYINRAKNYVSFYSNVKKGDNKKGMYENDEEDNEEDEKDNRDN